MDDPRDEIEEELSALKPHELRQAVNLILGDPSTPEISGIALNAAPDAIRIALLNFAQFITHKQRNEPPPEELQDAIMQMRYQEWAAVMHGFLAICCAFGRGVDVLKILEDTRPAGPSVQ